MRILDLFSGIGGFSLGLHRASEKFQTVAFCEMDPFCTQILNKHWPDVPVYPDIRKLNGKEIGAIDIVCGGPPCQPFSQAGKRRGKEDDRDLWPEMFRIIKECQPSWVVGENVAGFVNMALDRTVSHLEGEGYEVRTFVLGAVSVQAPHQRQRCWIIGRKDDAHSHGQGESDGSGHEEWLQRDVADRNGSGLQGGVQDRESYPEGRQESGNGEVAERGTGRQGNRNGHGSTECGMGYLADGLSARLLDIGSIWHLEPDIPRVSTGEKNRVKKLKALGNSVVPQIPEIIGRLIMEVEREIQ